MSSEMSQHLTEEQLVLYHYGEAEGRAGVAEHLGACPACRGEYAALEQVLAAVAEAPVPERGEDYGSQVWQKLRTRLPERRASRWFGFLQGIPTRRWIEAGAMAVLLLAAFLAISGRACRCGRKVMNRLKVFILAFTVAAAGAAAAEKPVEPARAASEARAAAMAAEAAVAGQVKAAELMAEKARLAVEEQAAGYETMALKLARVLGDEAQQRADEKVARVQERAREAQQRASGLYERGTEALHERKWQRAVESFDQVAKSGGARADGAFYWKAYALNKLGQRPDALAALEELKKSFANSRWMNDAKALEVEIRQSSGQSVSPEAESDEDLKLTVLNGLIHTDAERAAPILEKLLTGSQSPKIKERALFVLSQSNSPKAREVLARIARGGSNPDLQMRALKNLGLFGGPDARQMLADIYAASIEMEVKKAILQSFMVSGARDRVLAAAKAESTPELRREAVRQLGVMGAREELWQLYSSEASADVKGEILHSLFIGGAVDKLMEVAKGEKDPQLRRKAVHSLGISGKRTGDFLVSLYAGEKDPEIRRQIIQALFVQGNAAGLVELARKETGPSLKKELIQKLSIMRSKEATDYLLEVLNK